jgi:hypothetical protein
LHQTNPQSGLGEPATTQPRWPKPAAPYIQHNVAMLSRPMKNIRLLIIPSSHERLIGRQTIAFFVACDEFKPANGELARIDILFDFEMLL